VNSANAAETNFKQTPDLASSVARLIAESAFGSTLLCSAVILVLGQSASTERLCYALIAVLVVPVGAVITWRANRNNQQSAPVQVIGTAGITAAAIVAARLIGTDHVSAWLGALLVLGRLLVMLMSRLSWELPRSPAAFALVPALLAIGAASFASAGPVSFGRLAMCAIAALLVAWLTLRVPSASTSRFRVAIDVSCVLLVMLTVFQLTDVNMTRSENMAFFLGPTNDVLHGQPVLVDTFSQYGVGMYYAIAAAFSFLPLGFGVFTLLLALGSSLLFVCIYAVLRLSLSSQLIAVLGVATAVIAYIYAGTWQYVDYPSTGVLRFGPAWLIVLLAVAEARTNSAVRSTLLQWSLLAVVGAAVVWSGEAGVYCMGTAVAIALLDSATLDAPLRARAHAAVRSVLAIVAAALIALMLFTVLTLVFTGSWPDWGPYIAYVRLYTTGGLGLLPIERWSPGIAVGVLYGVSATVLVGLLIVRPQAARDRPAPFRGVAGVTVMGALEFTYFLGRAAPTNLVHVAAPAVALVFLWIGIAMPVLTTRRAAATVAAAAAFLGALVVAGDYADFTTKFDDSALGALVAGPSSVSSRVSALADNSVSDPRSPRLVRFIDSVDPGRRPLTLIAWPAVETETLIRGGLANLVGSSNPCQEAISPTGAVRALHEIGRLTTGGLLVTYTTPTAPLLAFQTYELREIDARLTLKPFAARDGFVAYRLRAVRKSWHGGGSLKRPQPATALASGCQ
jgi:hypothetical protein